ncbi:hypothetical protein VR7878_00829 [Vibrio ruber DSM 16370]|uniref:Uncharacterized protein n=1 Tax=Vibrio ruber (strain DSM 16370 / JCM 11486 / BCRC 17186 / CECT 7878 / LMG 23124 / VR1) TaxID=1123498 RepID=A0A1R4LDD4_VIBR1|nr:hypothetical protein VR7878_00829 [Vibrio ruber DSM 16370]
MFVILCLLLVDQEVRISEGGELNKVRTTALPNGQPEVALPAHRNLSELRLHIKRMRYKAWSLYAGSECAGFESRHWFCRCLRIVIAVGVHGDWLVAGFCGVSERLVLWMTWGFLFYASDILILTGCMLRDGFAALCAFMLRAPDTFALPAKVSKKVG